MNKDFFNVLDCIPATSAAYAADAVRAALDLGTREGRVSIHGDTRSDVDGATPYGRWSVEITPTGSNAAPCLPWMEVEIETCSGSRVYLEGRVTWDGDEAFVDSAKLSTFGSKTFGSEVEMVLNELGIQVTDRDYPTEESLIK